jgi:3-hydroxyisobutyrate dehydrogenase
MGGDQARLIAESDHNLTVFDVSASARARFSEVAVVADSVESAVADADLVHICVRDAEQVNEVLFGAGNAAAAAKPGSLFLVHSTIDIETVKAIADRMQRLGLQFADAPVTRTRPDSDGRFVLSMIGGESDAFVKARPVLETFSTGVLHAGPCGSAMALKIANNMMTWMQLVVGSLTFELAESFDIDVEDLKSVTRANGNLTPTTEAFLSGSRANRSTMTAEQREFVDSQAGIGEKDLSLAIDACHLGTIDTRMIELAQELLRPAMLGSLDTLVDKN